MILVHSILSDLSIYFLSFLIGMKVAKLVELQINKFLRGPPRSARKSICISWEKVGMSKKFRDAGPKRIKEVNIELLFKLVKRPGIAEGRL